MPITSVTELPFNRFLCLQSVAEPLYLLRLPGGGQYLNYLGTVHAGALIALAEAASAEFLLRRFGSREDVVPVVRCLDSKFRKFAHGAVVSTAHADPRTLAQLDVGPAAKGRALILVAVELYDEFGTHALSASVEWFIQRLNPNEPSV